MNDDDARLTRPDPHPQTVCPLPRDERSHNARRRYDVDALREQLDELTDELWLAPLGRARTSAAAHIEETRGLLDALNDELRLGGVLSGGAARSDGTTGMVAGEAATAHASVNACASWCVCVCGVRRAGGKGG